MKFRIDWSGRSHSYSDKEIETVVQIMESSDTLTQGQHLQNFEAKIKNFIGVNHAFGLTSAASALELIALMCDIKKGEEVIIPSHTYCASAIPFGRVGAKIVWADIDPNTFVISPDDIIKKITEKTKVLVVVHLYGLACEMDKISKICSEKNIILVEDCAQAFGAKFKNKRLGSYGDFACFSFHSQKNITTLGEGGCLVVKSKEKAKLVPGLRHNGHAPYPSREFYWKPAMGNVDLDIPGIWPYNFSMTEVQAALGESLIDRVDILNNFRRDRAKVFIDAMSEFPELVFQQTPHKEHNSYHLLPAFYNGTKYRTNNDDFINIMAKTYSIKCIVQYYPLNRYPLFVKMGFGEANCPNADHFFDNMISFPFHHWMEDKEFQYLIQSTKSALNELRGN